MSNNQEKRIAKCKFCGREFSPKNQRNVFCSTECCKKYHNNKSGAYAKDLNRPYTKDTKFLIRKWHSEGMSIKRIADVLSRSEESVMLAFEQSANS